MEPLTHSLERSVEIQAAPETVFAFFTGDERWSRWWGAGSTIDARPGGKLLIRYPGGVEALGEVLEVSPPERIVFTYGYASGKPIAPGSSRVTIQVRPRAGGAQVVLRHEFSDPAVREEHIQGWRYQLSVFANAVADEVCAGAAAMADAWFGAWTIADGEQRAAAFARIASPEVRFQDRYSALQGLEDLVAHSGATQRFMPGVRLERAGVVRHCQNNALAGWVARGPDGREVMTGTNLFVLGADGRIQAATGFANPPAASDTMPA